MLRRLLAITTAMILTGLGLAGGLSQATAATGPNVSITATAGPNGTTTLTYRASATAAGTLSYIQVSIPPGSTGRITSINGTVRTVAPNVLRWTPNRTITVGVGARFALPFYGLRLPAGGPWRLGFNAPSTTGTKIAYGTAVLYPLVTKTYTPDVVITAKSEVPGPSTTLRYSGTVTRYGTLSSIVMQLPAGTTGSMTSVNGTLTVSNNLAVWTPKAPITVGPGARLGIPIYGAVLPSYEATHELSMSARTSTNVSLMAGLGTLTLTVPPPAPMPEVPVTALPPVPAGCPSAWPTTAEENALPGTGEWVIPAERYNSSKTAAYLTEVSTTCGDAVDLKVSSGKPVSIVAYRMGYYDGLGAREIWRAENVPTVVQPAPTIGGYDAEGNELRMVSAANWSKTLTIPVDERWVPGTYLIRVDDGMYAAYAPLTVRDDTGTKHDILIQQATTTWQAYNRWGGGGFYSAIASGRLSFDRPYEDGMGSGQFLSLEQGLVFWAEANGLDVTYWTNNDLDQFGGQLPARASTIFLPGHDEYYSMTMRAALSQAIEQGVNVGNIGANAIWRYISFTTPERRTWDIDRYTAGGSSTTWRWLGDGYSSQALLGAEYHCWLYGDTLTTGTSWLFEGITPGTQIPGFIAGEIDSVHNDLYRHPGIQVVATGTGFCGNNGPTMPMETTAFTAPSGARVFNASTFAFGCYLGGSCSSGWTVPNPPLSSRQTVGIMMANVTKWVTNGEVVIPSAALSASSTPKLKVTLPPMSIPLRNE